MTELEKSDDGDVTIMRSIILKDFSGKEPVEKVVGVVTFSGKRMAVWSILGLLVIVLVAAIVF